MKRNLIRYLPDILKRSLDFVELMKVQEAGLTGTWDSAQAVFDGQYITTADEYAIARYEGILGLTPGDDDDLETRRKAVLMAWRRCGNPGLPDLQEVADLWEPQYTVLEYAHPLMILVWLTEYAPYGPISHLATLMRQLRKLAPANIDFDTCLRFLRIKEMHRQMSVADLNKTLLHWFAGGTGMSDRTRGSGLLQFGKLIIVRERSKITVRDDGTMLHISSGGPDYDAPEYHQIGDGLWDVDNSLTVAADSRVDVRDDGETLHITYKED